MPRRAALIGALSFALATALSTMGVIYAATTFLDGADDPSVWALERRFLRRLPWFAALMAGLGAGAGWFHQRCLSSPARLPGKVVLLSVARAFFHFPLYGGMVLVHFICVLLGTAARAMWRRAIGASPPPEVDVGERISGSVPLLFVLAPFGGQNASRWRSGVRHLALWMKWWLPFVLLALWIWTGAVSEDTGERVDPIALSLAGAVWLGDYLLLGVLLLRFDPSRAEAEPER